MKYSLIIKRQIDGYKTYSLDRGDERYMNQIDELSEIYIDNLVGELIEINFLRFIRY